MQSGLAYTILRPGRLTDGPYTSFDLNTLLQATAGTRQDIQVAARDELNGETSRIALAGMPLMMRLPCALRNFNFSKVVYNTHQQRMFGSPVFFALLTLVHTLLVLLKSKVFKTVLEI